MAFLKTFFGDLPVRFRASYFPFTEPSVEVDVLKGIPEIRRPWIEKRLDTIPFLDKYLLYKDSNFDEI